jgi:hypothetical protein
MIKLAAYLGPQAINTLTQLGTNSNSRGIGCSSSNYSKDSHEDDDNNNINDDDTTTATIIILYCGILLHITYLFLSVISHLTCNLLFKTFNIFKH